MINKEKILADYNKRLFKLRRKNPLFVDKEKLSSVKLTIIESLYLYTHVMFGKDAHVRTATYLNIPYETLCTFFNGDRFPSKHARAIETLWRYFKQIDTKQFNLNKHKLRWDSQDKKIVTVEAYNQKYYLKANLPKERNLLTDSDT